VDTSEKQKGIKQRMVLSNTGTIEDKFVLPPTGGMNTTAVTFNQIGLKHNIPEILPV